MLQVLVLKTFEFDHHSMTMSVLVKLPDGSLVAYCKGAPEKMDAHCTSKSLPDTYMDTVAEHALNGCYVLALGVKSMPSSMTDKQATPPPAPPALSHLPVLPPPSRWCAQIADVGRAELESDLTLIALAARASVVKLRRRDRLKPRVAAAVGALPQRAQANLGRRHLDAQGGRRAHRDDHRRQRAVRQLHCQEGGAHRGERDGAPRHLQGRLHGAGRRAMECDGRARSAGAHHRGGSPPCEGDEQASAAPLAAPLALWL